MREHKHLIVRAIVENPIIDKDELSKWMRETVDAIDMKIMSGPLLSYAEEKINQGWTAIAIIEFSHISLHIWELEGLIEFDVFSCKAFDIDKVIQRIRPFGLKKLSVQYIDRDQNFGELQKFWVAYKTSCLTNGKYYYGVHGSSYIDQRYLGSGKIIKKAIEKHGRENFKVEILKFFLDEESAYLYEAELVNKETLKDPQCYNVIVGGKHGGPRKKKTYDFVWVTDGEKNKLLKREEAIKNYVGVGWDFGRTVKDETRLRQSKSHEGKTSWRKGKKGIVSNKTKEKTKITLKTRYQTQVHHSKGKIVPRDSSGRFKRKSP